MLFSSAVLLTANPRTNLVFSRWIMNQLSFGIPSMDQHTLTKALQMHHRAGLVTAGVIVPEWGFAWYSHKQHGDDFGCRTTKVITASPQVCHSHEGRLCERAVVTTPRPRVYAASQCSGVYYSSKDLLDQGLKNGQLKYDQNKYISFDFPSYNFMDVAIPLSN